MRESAESEATPLPCCNYIEAVYDHDPEGPCEGTMQPGWPEYVCGTCRARCGSLAHPTHAFPPATPYTTADLLHDLAALADARAEGEGVRDE